MRRKNTLAIIFSLLVATAIISQAQSQVPIVAKARAITVNPLITGGQPPQPLPIDSTFSITVSALDIEKVWGYQFILSYNTTVLTATSYTNSTPFDKLKHAEEINDEPVKYLNVSAFDNTNKTWTPVGIPPGTTVRPDSVHYCLNKIDYPNWYINATADNATIGNFHFADLTPLEAGGPVYIEIYTRQPTAGDDAVEIWLYNATSKEYDKVDTLTPPSGTWDWKTSRDVSSWLSNMTLINGAKVYLVKKTNGATADNIEIDAMRLKVNSGYGYVSLSWSSYNGDEVGATGANVTLAKINFVVEANGTSTLDLHDSRIADVDANWGDPAVTGLGEEDGYYGELPLHDVAVTSVTATPTSANPGDSVTIDVIVANLGEFSETVSVSTAYNLTDIDFVTIENRTDISLAVGEDKTLSFTWDIPADFKEISCVVRGKVYFATDMRQSNNQEDSEIITIQKTTYTPWIIYGAVAGVVIIIGAAVGIALIRRRKK
jgi:hypothetical protein